MNYITAQLFSEHIYRVKNLEDPGAATSVNFEDHVDHEDHESHVFHEVHVVHKALENVTDRHLNF